MKEQTPKEYARAERMLRREIGGKSPRVPRWVREIAERRGRARDEAKQA